MGKTPFDPMTPLLVRLYEVGDEQAVLGLIDTDRLPGQPRTTRAMLGEALGGRSPVDGDWWAALDPPVTDVVCGPDARVLGVVSCAVRRRDGEGFLLW
ncbi:GNAT family N-acetyltransferase, partial [Streptomyces sp. NPDC002920]